MSALLTICVTSEPIERLRADLAVVAVFSDQRPLRGGAGRVDWRLCGLISEWVASGRFGGEEGQALLLPCQGRLRAPRVLVLGLGPRAKTQPPASRSAAHEAFRRGLALGARTFALDPLGIDAEEVPQHAEVLVNGPLQALREAGIGATLRLTVPEDGLWATTRALTTLAGGSRAATEVSVINSETPRDPASASGVTAAQRSPGGAGLGSAR